MAKKPNPRTPPTNRPPSSNPFNPKTKGLSRLEGDALFAWAQMVTRWEHVSQAKNNMAEMLLTERGFAPGEYLLSDDGYIISREQYEEKLKREGRIRSLPARPPAPDQIAPSAPPSLPDSGT